MVVAGALVGPMTGYKGLFDLRGEVARALCPAVITGTLRLSQFSAAARRTCSTLARSVETRKQSLLEWSCNCKINL